MAYKIVYLYDSSVNLDDVPHKLVEDLVSGEIEECIANCMELKRAREPIPVGFQIIDYDEYDLNDCITKTYYFNGTILDQSNIPAEWRKEKLFNRTVKKLIYIPPNFCIPFNEETDTILHIPNF